MRSLSFLKNKRKDVWVDACLIIAAMIAWAIMFRGYLSGKVAIFDDAISYYDHIRFYLENIARGVFPLWDPLWFGGVANSFFLQRMGCFNPFLMVTLVFKALGFSYTSAYLIYLMFYYFVGCTGFYFLAREVIRDRVCSYTAFLLLLFSALGSRSFDSFMILMFTPLVWFFYFLVRFSRKPQRFAFIGMMFCLMIVGTTYIPFYFLLSVVTFVIVCVLIAPKQVWDFLQTSKRFVVQNKMLVLVSVVFVCLAFVPGYLFFKAGGKGDFVMPMRNTNQGVGSVLGVQAQDHSNSWALLEELFFAWHYYTDIRQIKFAVIYVPLFAAIIALLGLTTRITKKVFLLFVWMAVLLLICIPKASPIYSFLYQHMVIFKYFRNLHFYLWVTILPLLCLFLGLQLRNYLDQKPSSLWQKFFSVVYIVIVHVMLLVGLNYLQFPLVTSYGVVILSCLFFVWKILGDINKQSTWLMVCVLLLVSFEPFELYTYLSQNTKPVLPGSYTYNKTTLDFRYVRGMGDVETVTGDEAYGEGEPGQRSSQRVLRPMNAFYYASNWFTYLSANVDMYVIKKYLTYKFVVYDSVFRMDEESVDFADFETALAENRNVAYVSTDDKRVLDQKTAEKSSYYARQIHGPQDDFYVESFTSNHVKIKTKFTKPQFVVYNDNDHRKWRLWINGVLTPIVRSNIAFKGVWVFPGEQTLEFRFGLPQTWLIYGLLFIGINGMFIALLFFRYHKDRSWKTKANSEVEK